MSPRGRPKGEYRSAQHEGSPVSGQRGGSLLITLVAMAMLLLGAGALLPSTDTVSAIASNTATKEAAAEAADAGLQAAAVKLSGLTNLDASVAGTYFATQQAVDANGLLTADWSGAAIRQVGAFRVQYLIDRLCDAPLPVADSAVQCSIAPTVGHSTSHKVGAPLFIPNAPVYFRVTARVVGPRNSESFIQAVVSK